ncbi:MAG: ribonuclease J [Clostridia bacterium]|nr:ribonuclease J [Clostridia bacterium]
MAKTVRVAFLGGVGEIGKNMTALEYGDDIIIVDCGVEFPREDSPGIDAIIPDVTYIKENIHKLRGVVLTHGHEDHIGALPYYAEEFDTPIYGTPLTLGLLQRKLSERNVPARLKEVKEGDTVKLGCFSVEFIKVAHSMAGACALSVTTPLGVIFFTGDFKLDRSPIDNKKTNIKRIKEIGDNGVMLMLGESTNVERKGHSTSEKVVGQGLDHIFSENQDKRIVISCFSSSNYRIQQILWLAEKYNRKVYLAGRSMKSIVEVASKVGELKIPKGVIVDGVGKTRPEKLVIIATGTQGEPESALSKLSTDDFGKGITLGENDIVVLSSTPIPGNEKSVYQVINNLFRQGADVVYDSMNDVHVSGHAYEDELSTMLDLVRPRFFMPVHGEYRHQFKHVQLAVSRGIPERNTAIPNIGEVWGVNHNSLRQHSNIPSGNVYVDGEVMEDGNGIVRDRRILSEYGMIVLLVAINSKKHRVEGDVEVIPRGVNITDERYLDIVNAVNRSVAESKDLSLYELTGVAKKAVRKLFYRDRQFPMIIPVIIED